MKINVRFLIVLTICVLLIGCSSQEKDCSISLGIDDNALAKGQKQIATEVLPAQWRTMTTLDQLPEMIEMKYDFRHVDASNLNITQKEIIKNIQYDTATIWPDDLADWFHPEEWLENGKNPGLGIRTLHEQGITGKGINIAIIDQALLLDHIEYKDQIQMYEVMHSYNEEAAFHGSAVTSLAVGKNIGVAPDAHVYYIASDFLDSTCSDAPKYEENLNYMADGIERILEINKLLPEEEKIRVISISKEFDDLDKADHKRVFNAIETAKKENVFVITPSLHMNYDYAVSGLDRDEGKDMDSINSYHLTSLLRYDGGRYITDTLFIPMGNRTIASFSAVDGYEYSTVGGYSWICPWLAGMYALTLQANPNITPEQFLDIAYHSGVQYIDKETHQISNDLENIIQPLAIIEEVKNLK